MTMCILVDEVGQGEVGYDLCLHYEAFSTRIVCYVIHPKVPFFTGISFRALVMSPEFLLSRLPGLGFLSLDGIRAAFFWLIGFFLDVLFWIIP